MILNIIVFLKIALPIWKNFCTKKNYCKNVL